MIVYLNGQWVGRDEAKVSVEDRGFLFADGIYEVVRYYAGHALAMDLHTKRMDFGLDALRIRLPKNVDLAKISDELMRRNKLRDAAVYWQVTRGVAPRAFTFPAEGTEPTVFAIAYPAAPLEPDAPTPTLTAITRPDIRWLRCEIKAISLLPNVLASQEAADAGCSCAILERDGIVTEATSRSIFIAEEGQLWTYPLDGRILDSITRRLAIELAGPLGIDVVEEPFELDRLYSADEVIAVGSTTEVAAVTEVDGKAIGDGLAGPIARRLFGAYRGLVFERCSGGSAATSCA